MKTASLREVDVSLVTLKELVEFIEDLRIEFPMAIRILEKKLKSVQPEKLPEEKYYEQQLDDEKVMASLELLKGAIGQQATGEISSRFVLGLHKEFGFGKVRILRAFMATREDGNELPTIADLQLWCNNRGIDYNEVFAYGPTNRQVLPQERS